MTTEMWEWITDVPGRSPRWKMHETVGHAKNALQKRRYVASAGGYVVAGGTIYRLIEGKVVHQVTVPAGSTAFDRKNLLAQVKGV